MKGIFFILVILTIAFCVIFIIREIPAMKISLRIRKLKRQIQKISRYWNGIERKFVKDEQFRETFVSDPCKLSRFFKVVDQVNGTDFCNRLTPNELEGLFKANPEVVQSRVEEYLCYMKTART